MAKNIPVSICTTVLCLSFSLIGGLTTKALGLSTGTTTVKLGIIDCSGKWVVPPDYLRIHHVVGSDLFWVTEPTHGTTTIINSNGKVISSKPGADMPLVIDSRVFSPCPLGKPTANPVVVGGKMGKGLCDPEGHSILSPIYETISFVGDDYVLAQPKRLSDPQGVGGEESAPSAQLINLRTKRTVTLPDSVNPSTATFGDGLLSCRVGDSKYGAFASDGTLRFTLSSSSPVGLQAFSEGLAAACPGTNNLWGYINKDGKMIIAAKYSTASPFKRGFAIVSVASEQSHKYGVINTDGETVLPLEFDSVSWLDDDCLALIKDGKCTILDRKLKTILVAPKTCSNITQAREGRYVGWFADHRKAYLDQNGEIVSPLFDEAGAFQNSVAIVGVLKNGQMRRGLIGLDCHWILPPIYDTLVVCGKDRIVANKPES